MTPTKMIMLVSLLAATGCSNGGASNLAEKHLQLISSKKSGEAQAQYCSQKDNLRLIEVNSYELQSESEINNGKEYIYAVDSPNVADSVTIQVIDSDAFFDLSMNSSAQLNESREKVAELTGTTLDIVSAPKREDYSQEEQCIFLPFEQFES